MSRASWRIKGVCTMNHPISPDTGRTTERAYPTPPLGLIWHNQQVWNKGGGRASWSVLPRNANRRLFCFLKYFVFCRKYFHGKWYESMLYKYTYCDASYDKSESAVLVTLRVTIVLTTPEEHDETFDKSHWRLNGLSCRKLSFLVDLANCRV